MYMSIRKIEVKANKTSNNLQCNENNLEHNTVGVSEVILRTPMLVN